MRNEVLKAAKRIVVKIGSSLVSSRAAGLEPERIDRLADDLAAIQESRSFPSKSIRRVCP
jgi:glutamate 5-kinase